MDTNLKDIDVFKGVVSFVAMVALILLLAGGTVAVIYIMIPMCDGWLTLNALASWASDLWMVQAVVAGGSILLLLAGMIVLAVIFRKERRQVAYRLGALLGKLWVEVKLLLTFLYCACAVPILAKLIDVVQPTSVQWVGMDGQSWSYLDYTPLEDSLRILTGFISIAVLAVLWLYLLCLDIGVNRRYFRHNIIHSILTWVDRCKKETPLAKLDLRRFIVAAACTLAIVPATVFALDIVDHRTRLWQYPFLSPLIVLLAIAGGCAIWAWYTWETRRLLRDVDILQWQLHQVYQGNLDVPCPLPQTSDLYTSAMELSMIHTGLQRAVDEGVRSERTKVELITNMSHDIKTPLTSVIGYIELLKKEELPAQAEDYVNVIAIKAERLRQIVQDVFEVSKAATGNIALRPEPLDLARLLRQTFAELDEVVSAAPITWRMDIPEEPVPVFADGQRLYRVFQNLLRNCAQYSLEGSRAYVSLQAEEGQARVTLRNVSKAELTRTGEELTGRFVRGDLNRTGDGSGLGLSIAQSFTEASGGTLQVRTEGDLFTVTVTLPLYQPPEEPVPEPKPEGVSEAQPGPAPEDGSAQ